MKERKKSGAKENELWFFIYARETMVNDIVHIRKASKSRQLEQSSQRPERPLRYVNPPSVRHDQRPQRPQRPQQIAGKESEGCLSGKATGYPGKMPNIVIFKVHRNYKRSNQWGIIFQIFSRSRAAHDSNSLAHALHSENSALFSCPNSSATYKGSPYPRSRSNR